jgi:hypothetical protein
MNRHDKGPKDSSRIVAGATENDREARQAERVWRSVMAHGLPGAPDEYPSRPLTERAWALVLGRARAGNVMGLLGAAVSSERLPVDPSQRTTIAADLAAMRDMADRADRRLVEVLEVLDPVASATDRPDSRVPIAIGSIAMAYTSYDDPSWRDRYGVDLLLTPASLASAVAALVTAGATHDPTPAADPSARRHTGGVPLIWSDGGPVVLHGALCAGPYGQRIDADRLREGQASFTVLGRAVAALGREQRLLHVCLGAVLAGPSPTSAQLRDIAQLAHDRRIDLDAAVLLAEAWRDDTVLAAGLRMAADAVSTWVNPISMVWAQTHEPTLLERSLLRSQRGRTAAPAAALVERLGTATGTLGRLMRRVPSSPPDQDTILDP